MYVYIGGYFQCNRFQADAASLEQGGMYVYDHLYWPKSNLKPSYTLTLPPQIITLWRHLLPTLLNNVTTSFSTSLGQGGGVAAGDGDDEEEGDEAADHIMSTLSAHASIVPHVS